MSCHFVRLWATAGAQVNAKDALWVTPLHFACASGSDECAEVLLNHGADAGARDKTSYCTPLHVAAGFGHSDLCQRLINHNAMPEGTDRQGRQPIHQAAFNGYEDVVR
jgi:ankyrin repeat protein